ARSFTPTPPCGPSCSVVDSPNPSATNTLYGVTSIADNDAWAVGVTNGQPLIEHWDGATWGVVAAPILTATLNGVAAISADNVWAVGSQGVIANSQTCIVHWNGTSWVRVPSPSVVGARNALSGGAAVCPSHFGAG